ncbi:MAG: glycoside hydrolase family 2 TIM barrel-domain containing protein [Spirochaetales bacterium]|nr:glycoside hydrolase family 2 TIM barrel-domain containing protein [Spirochaetales bacterium]
MRRIIELNQNWLFFDAPMGKSTKGVTVDLPHSIRELPLNNFDEAWYQKKVCYCKEFPSPKHAAGGRIFLDFEAVAVSCKVWLNERPVGGHDGPYTPFSLDITEALNSEGDNRLWVEVDAAEDPDIPPFGGVVDYLVYGGIYRGVSLRLQGPVHIAQFHARPKIYSFEPCKAALAVEVELSGLAPVALRLDARLSRSGNVVAEASKTLSVDGSSSSKPPMDYVAQRYNLNFPPLENILPWDIDTPALYDLEIFLYRDGEEVDVVRGRIGFREAVFTGDGFFLNGRRVFLRGLNRHQSWPYSGYAMGPGAQKHDATMLKRELGCVVVRTSHYPQSRHFLDACDELGLLVFTELPGWQHIGGEAWKNNALGDLESLIKRDRNHPSVILWGVRINESPDDDEFYRQTNALAAALDPDRQRGGVRNFSGSAFFEDVYTFNDFTHDGGKKVIAKKKTITRNAKKKAFGKIPGTASSANFAPGIAGGGTKKALPYLITEHNGHMFPAKRWDQEERLAEHARRHARVLNAAMGDSGIAGAIGWCAFDYNTHRDFGSGDRVCYHGVTDMFRSPKYAAYLYSSQKSPGEGIVLEPASRFAKGERSGAVMLPVDVYTNCDAVDLYRSGELVGRFYPDRQQYPHLEHPPILINDLIGRRLEPEGFSTADAKRFLRLAAKAMSTGISSFKFKDKLDFAFFLLKRGMRFKQAQDLVMKYGLAWGRADDGVELVGILEGKPVASRRFSPDARAAGLEAEISPRLLTIRQGGEWESSRVALRLVDQYGNTCPFAFEPIHIELDGPGRLIGPGDRSLLCGEAVFWVASTGLPGRIELKIRGPEWLMKPTGNPLDLCLDVECCNG